MILPTQEGEHVIFDWLQENPPETAQRTSINIALYHSGLGKRSDLFFHRSLNVQLY